MKVCMAYIHQLDLFEETDELTILRNHINSIDEKYSKVQRGIFAKHADLMKLVMKQQEEINTLIYEINSKKEVLDFKFLQKMNDDTKN
jgi:hypothetical protein